MLYRLCLITIKYVILKFALSEKKCNLGKAVYISLL